MPDEKKIRLLIVDDIAETRHNVRTLCNYAAGYIEVIGEARTGREAINKAFETEPDVILMDINMPDMDGLTATQVIRKRLKHTGVVVLSVQSDPDYMRRAMLAGVQDFLTKPPMYDELLDAIRRAKAIVESQASALQQAIVSNNQTQNDEHLHLKKQELEITIFDLTARLELYQQSPITASLVNEIELLISGLAHDLRSPINIMLGILTTLPTKNERNQKDVERILRRCLYCKWIADNFLGISMSEKMVLRQVPMHQALDAAALLLENQLSTSIKIENQIPKDVSVYADANLINIVFLNLLTNAVESMPGGGIIRVDTLQEKNNMLITIEDDGEMIPLQHRINLFSLGFTTKKAHSGTGLYVARRLMQQQGGDLIYTQYSEKKVFGLLFPLQPPPPKPIAAHTIADLEAWSMALRQRLEEAAKYVLTEEEHRAMIDDFKRLSTTFSQNLSHELSAIEALTKQITLRLAIDENQLTTALMKVNKNCAYCRLLTNNILEIGEESSPRYSKISLIDVAETVLSLIDRKMPENLYRVEWDVDPTLTEVEADEVQLDQVFMNLIRNSLDAMPHGGTLGIQISQDHEEAVVKISDTGIGISPDHLPRLFQLGFTTKPKGYGIGLYSIRNILQKHGGQIQVLSKPGQGTTFVFRLPIVQKKVEVKNE